MLEGLKAILYFITQTINSIVAFFGFVITSVAALGSYITIMPPWLSVLFLAVVAILVVRLFIGR